MNYKSVIKAANVLLNQEEKADYLTAVKEYFDYKKNLRNVSETLMPIIHCFEQNAQASKKFLTNMYLQGQHNERSNTSENLTVRGKYSC